MREEEMIQVIHLKRAIQRFEYDNVGAFSMKSTRIFYDTLNKRNQLNATQ